MIEVKHEDIVDGYDVDEIVANMNGLLELLNDGYGYKEGVRNNIAVDLCCYCYVLGIDPIDIVKDLKLSYWQRHDFKNRIGVIEGYLDYWHRTGGVDAYTVLPSMETDKEFVKVVD